MNKNTKGDILNKTVKYIFLVSLMLLLWNTDILKPIKIVPIFIHEMGHVLASCAVGNKISTASITLSDINHTHMLTNKWLTSFIIANSGYVASLLFAIFILKIKNAKIKRYTLGIVTSLVLVSLLYIGKIPATFLYVIILSVITMAIYILNNDKIFEITNDILGISSISYCIYETVMKDILPKIATNTNMLKGFYFSTGKITDANTLHKITGIPTILWGIVWLSVSILTLLFCLKNSKKSKRRY